jgi:hypothetical protein
MQLGGEQHALSQAAAAAAAAAAKACAPAQCSAAKRIAKGNNEEKKGLGSDAH